MKKTYVATIGIPDDLKQIDSDPDREYRTTANNVYEAHKAAFNSCNGVEEVLYIISNNRKVFDRVTGFTRE